MQDANSSPPWRLLTLVGAVAFCVTLIAKAPASLVGSVASAANLPIAYSSSTGTIWNGALNDVSWAGVGLGDVEFDLSFLSLALLQPEANIMATGGAAVGQGRIALGAAGQRIKLADVDADISLRGVAPRGVFGQPAAGRATIRIERLAFSRQRGCLQAVGEVWTDVLDAPAQRFNLPKLPLSGSIRCDGDQLAIVLEGRNARAGASMLVTVDKSYTYEIAATASPVEESVASALRVFGFEDDNGGLIYGSAGVLAGAGS